MDMKLLIQGQRSMTVAMPVDDDLAKTLLMLCQVGDRLGDNINLPRPFEVEVHPIIHDIRKVSVLSEREVQDKSPSSDVMHAQLYYDMRLRGLGMAILDRKTGKNERAGNTVVLTEADLTGIVATLLRRKAMDEREMRIAQRGGKDRRKGGKGREARQRIGKIKHELHQEARQEGDEGAAEE